MPRHPINSPRAVWNRVLRSGVALRAFASGCTDASLVPVYAQAQPHRARKFRARYLLSPDVAQSAFKTTRVGWAASGWNRANSGAERCASCPSRRVVCEVEEFDAEKTTLPWSQQRGQT